eukprot:CAMPEP_0198144734 /NCGR_PEP_ID=MMETSP1443-20131203/18208_1 /TAXON_ID=186043 /ORGANISM="Entomoneis sp., Strain CCMP2396" /LENGTH=216 /DNA_ID=CAMNT_0043808189 /DNA_START=206 /DNA_END=856 /DNA_ORIENTATION=-
MSASSASGDKQIVMDPFCFRQFSEHESSKTYKGTVFSDITIAQMEDAVNEYYDESKLKDGYAPFCKHLFLKNDGLTKTAKLNVLKITPENEHLLRSEYQARNEKELPVLARHFPAHLLKKENVESPVATYLDIILYSREQIQKEDAAQGDTSQTAVTASWGIISIKAQDVDTELPMTPITALRNALGKEEGGSGVPINRTEYMAAAKYWSEHATIS